MSTTPTTPQWMQDAVREIHPWEVAVEGAGSLDDMQSGYDENEENLQEDQRILAIIAKHAPSPAAQPTDEAKLRHVIQCAVVFGGECDDLPAKKARELIDRILTALAPHLAQREPGDSELAKELRDMLAELSDVCDGNYYELVKSAKALINRYDKSAQRGEGKP